MKFFENKIKSNDKKSKLKKQKNKKIIISILSRLGALIFHEDYAIFSLPLIFFSNIFLYKFILFFISDELT